MISIKYSNTLSIYLPGLLQLSVHPIKHTMYKLLPLICCICFSQIATAQKKDSSLVLSSSTKPFMVDAACGQCRLGLLGKGCDLAVRIEGKAYFVDGTGIDEHGDAHADDGFCKAVRKAEVRGSVVEGRFKATSFVLVKEKPMVSQKQ